MNLQILLCGVGGQGILFATRILSETALQLGNAVIGSETHGMSQRGGSVTSHMKVGKHRGPLIRRGDADLIFCFERSEIFANLTFMKPGGIAYIDAPDSTYIPEKIRKLLKKDNSELRCFDASARALAMKAPLVLNQILIGFACSYDDFDLGTDPVRKVITEISPERFREMNLKAFDVGLEHKTVDEL
jgi:indolepyruvate ferredoxin oxidoreductase beta subunit